MKARQISPPTFELNFFFSLRAGSAIAKMLKFHRRRVLRRGIGQLLTTMTRIVFRSFGTIVSTSTSLTTVSKKVLQSPDVPRPFQATRVTWLMTALLRTVASQPACRATAARLLERTPTSGIGYRVSGIGMGGCDQAPAKTCLSCPIQRRHVPLAGGLTSPLLPGLQH